MEEKLDEKLTSIENKLEQKVGSTLARVEDKLESVEAKLGAIEGLNARMGEIEDQVTANVDDIENIQENMSRLLTDNKKLFAENKQIRETLKKLEDSKADSSWVASIHDEQLRNSMTVCGVKKGPNETYWKGTKATLATALAGLTGEEYSQRYWIRALQRAHRGKETEGKIPVIHCKFVSWADHDMVMNLFRGDDAVPNPDKLEFYEKFSDHTDDRRKKAVVKRTAVRANDKSIKSYIKYPADVMVKKPGETRYTCVQKF